MNKSNTSITIPDEIVMSTIYLIRSQKVMLDRDLADLYGVETKVLNQAVKRNTERFPSEFMFHLNEEESESPSSSSSSLSNHLTRSCFMEKSLTNLLLK